MIITKSQLRRLIKEEIQKELIKEGDEIALAQQIIDSIIGGILGAGLGALITLPGIALVDWLGSLGIGPAKYGHELKRQDEAWEKIKNNIETQLDNLSDEDVAGTFLGSEDYEDPDYEDPPPGHTSTAHEEEAREKIKREINRRLEELKTSDEIKKLRQMFREETGAEKFTITKLRPGKTRSGPGKEDITQVWPLLAYDEKLNNMTLKDAQKYLQARQQTKDWNE